LYYLDAVRYERWRRRRRIILAIGLGLVALLAIILAIVPR
jgi:hypothetical protein